jgi:hypothetical protein
MSTEPAGSCLMGVPFARPFSLAVELMECRTREELWCAASRLPHPPPVSERYGDSVNGIRYYLSGILVYPTLRM